MTDPQPGARQLAAGTCAYVNHWSARMWQPVAAASSPQGAGEQRDHQSTHYLAPCRPWQSLQALCNTAEPCPEELSGVSQESAPLHCCCIFSLSC